MPSIHKIDKGIFKKLLISKLISYIILPFWWTFLNIGGLKLTAILSQPITVYISKILNNLPIIYDLTSYFKIFHL